MSRSFTIILFLLCLGLSQIAFAQTTVSKFKTDSSSGFLVESIPEAKQFKDRALTTYVARRIARNFPFSPSASEFLDAARAQSLQMLENFKGGEFWFLPLGIIRIMLLLSGLLMVYRFELRSAKTFIFLFIAFGLIIGEGVNLSRGLFTTVFIPFEGEHFALSAPEANAQAVEKLSPGTEILVSEIAGDWLKLELASGRVGWVMNEDGIVESED